MSLRGNCRTLSERIDCNPAMRITRLTTIASTGRFMKRSVSFICHPEPRRRRGIPYLLAVLWFGGRVVPRLNRVVDRHRGARTEFEDARSHDLFPRLDAADHSDLIATRAAEFHELLANTSIALAIRAFDVF